MVTQRDRQRLPTVFGLDSGIEQLSGYVDQIWGQFLHGHLHQPAFGPSAFQPPVDVCQTADAVVVSVEAPGMRDQQIRLELDVNRLTIRGRRRHRQCEGEPVYSQMEIASGPFERTVLLPSEVDPQGAEVGYDDGYIEIRLPRLARRVERRLRIMVLQT